ncbi:hypothetical protein MVES_002671 [Malassezia vespertilionis]|uniref:Golgi apparatus membrane protein TVP38 n=1 Tax=Malassezia vespertilionis TaxID=2020962 RepID=A0A2N1JAM2_9BASI|nr:hypothetical protein MVES_002671 [Malassezia vespertilionis]
MAAVWTSRVRVAQKLVRGARALHQLPPAPPVLAEGCEPFLSKRTASLLWTQWQAGLLQRLNDEVKGTPNATESVVETVLSTARDRSKVLAFNSASLALNNSFFLTGLVPKSRQPNADYAQPSTHAGVVPTFYGKTLATAIADQYGSLPQLKLAFASAAMGTVSNGYIWLVKDEHGRLGIVPTFGAGTVLVHQRQQRMPQGLEGSVQDGQQEEATDTKEEPRTPSRFDSLAHASGSGVLGDQLYPLFCVSIFEHAWLGDYGFWGKERYLTNFWECVNWERAEQLWGADRRAAAYAAQSIVEAMARSFSPTFQHAASLFDSPTTSSPSQVVSFTDMIGEPTASPGVQLHAKQRAAVAALHKPSRRNISSTERFQRAAPSRADSDGARIRVASRGHEEIVARHTFGPANDSVGEHTIPMGSAIFAPQARRGALYLHADRPRRHARAQGQRVWLDDLRHTFKTLLGALRAMLHPRQLLTRQMLYWDEAFRDPETGARSWNPPWFEAYIPFIIWLGVSVTSTVIVVIFHTAVFSTLDALSVSLREWGVVGRILFGIMIFLTTFPPLPLYSTLVILSGFAFGMWQGFVVSYVAALLGALVVFVSSRSLLHSWMVRLMRRSGGLGKVVRAIEKAPKLLFLVRLAPYPYNLLNVLLASSSVLSLRTYMICTALALPKLIVHTALGASIKSFAEYESTPGASDAEQSSAKSMKHAAGFVGIALCIGIFLYLYGATARAVDDLDDKQEYELLSHDTDELLSSDDLEYEPQSAPVLPATPTPSKPHTSMPMAGPSGATPVSYAAYPMFQTDTPAYAPSLLAPANHQPFRHHASVSIADQIAAMERVAEDGHGQGTDFI